MNPTANDGLDISTLLPWLVEMGADEVLLDNPVDRFAAPVLVAEVPVKPRAPFVAPKPKPAVNWKAVAAGVEGVAAAEALAASIDSVEAYIEALDGFDAHPLKRTANKLCSVSGAQNARVLVFVDRPRNAEDATGDVLSGNHQVLADRMLNAIGLSGVTPHDSFEAAGLASFIPWRPPGNRALTELEAKMCVPLARRLLSLLAPKLILCFGHLPGQWLAGGEDAIFKARGKWVDMDGIPALTTFHPETLLQSPASKRMAWHDLQAFRQKLDGLP
jgi:uracil-DNA glycosylase